MKYFREKTALIKDSKIGDGSKIWNYVNIYGSRIGKYCTINKEYWLDNSELDIEQIFNGQNCKVYIEDYYKDTDSV